MNIGVFQFKGSGNLKQNHDAILRGISDASKADVRLLVFQECATTGYPPVELSSIDAIDFNQLEMYDSVIRNLAEKHNMFIALGTIRKDESVTFNSIKLIGPKGEDIGYYDKRALWGWDTENFEEGNTPGVFEIDGLRIGFRICFEVRFPEFFRELFESNVQLVFVSFCDVSEVELKTRYDVIKSHLITRAVENVMTVVSVNSASHYQTAPTAVFSPDGDVIDEANINEEQLIVYNFEQPEISFGRKGRIEISSKLLNENASRT
jgi:predicted amidohydrolase